MTSLLQIFVTLFIFLGTFYLLTMGYGGSPIIGALLIICPYLLFSAGHMVAVQKNQKEIISLLMYQCNNSIDKENRT